MQISWEKTKSYSPIPRLGWEGSLLVGRYSDTTEDVVSEARSQLGQRGISFTLLQVQPALLLLISPQDWEQFDQFIDDDGVILPPSLVRIVSPRLLGQRRQETTLVTGGQSYQVGLTEDGEPYIFSEDSRQSAVVNWLELIEAAIAAGIDIKSAARPAKKSKAAALERGRGK
jgi:hypothetical protein